MKFFFYIITISVIKLLAFLPAKILYLISDILSFTLYHIVRYRRKIVASNMRKAFPEWSVKEFNKTERKFYRNLADIILENAVIQYYSKSRLQKMFRFVNPEILDKYCKEGRHVIVVAGHSCNWEWSSPVSFTFNYQVMAVYKPLRNRYFDKEIRKARSRFGSVAVPMKNTGRVLIEYCKKEKPTLTGMVTDQRPLKKHVQYWTHFLNQKTAVLTGSEKLAKKINAVVVFMKVRRQKRGVYTGEVEIITENPIETAPFEITENHTRILEKLIREEPSNWLWSHNRWKYSYDDWKVWSEKATQGLSANYLQ